MRLAILCLALVACPKSGGGGTDTVAAPKAAAESATAELTSLGGGNLHGTVTFTKQDSGILVKIKIDDAAPGTHGIHIHEGGDCGDDGKNAGAHFNPDNHDHGDPSANNHHNGDLGNIEVDANGHGDKTMTVTEGFGLGTGDRSVLNRTVIFHEKKDDMQTQPGGDSGERRACGVIKAN